MITVALILLSFSLILSANMPLLGGRRLRGKRVRTGGVAMLLLSFPTFFVQRNTGYAIFALLLISIVSVYFFVKDEEPTADEAKENLFRSAIDELKTYADASKGIVAFIKDAIKEKFGIGVTRAATTKLFSIGF